MKKYKNLITLLVVFGSLHLVISAVIFPAFTKWFVDQNFDIKTFPIKTSYIFSAVQYAYVIIWIPVAVWIYRDSKKDMFSPWLWTILVLIAHYQGLIIYLLIKIIMDKERIESAPNNGIETDAE
jgi:hypothetical protein